LRTRGHLTTLILVLRSRKVWAQQHMQHKHHAQHSCTQAQHTHSIRNIRTTYPHNIQQYRHMHKRQQRTHVTHAQRTHARTRTYALTTHARTLTHARTTHARTHDTHTHQTANTQQLSNNSTQQILLLG
jgi:hypothetical protein